MTSLVLASRGRAWITRVRDALSHLLASPTLRAQHAEALRIADCSAYELVLAHGFPLESDAQAPPNWAAIGLAKDDGRECDVLSDADANLVEGFEWLHRRGLALLKDDPKGEFIALTDEGCRRLLSD
jgi:hypothetical protein